MIKAILFDFDDTLVQTKAIRFEAVKYTAKKFYDLSLTDEQISKSWGKPFAEMMLEIFNHADTLDNITHNYISVLPDYPNKPFPDTISSVKSLSEKYKLGIVSSNSSELIMSGLKTVGLNSDLFEYIQGADKSEYHKPDGRVFNPAFEFFMSLGISKPEIVYIGDSLDDVSSAKDAGINFVGIYGRTTTISQFEKEGVLYVPNLKDISEAIHQL